MFKVMLAGKVKDIQQVKFPVMVSPKLDGLRAYVMNGTVYSRSNKPFPNKRVQEMFGKFHGLDGELIVGKPTAEDVYRKTESVVMTADCIPHGINLWAFDMFDTETKTHEFCDGFLERSGCLARHYNKHTRIMVVPQIRINSVAELEAIEGKYLSAGYEGIMLRSLNGPYKQGRSTTREGYLLKLKRFEDAEAVITGCYEQLTNTNPRKLDELGRNRRTTHKAGKVGNGLLGGFHVKDLKTGVEFDIGTMNGVTMLERRAFWEQHKKLVGKLVKYRHQLCGAKDKPRFPVFVGFRNSIDLS